MYNCNKILLITLLYYSLFLYYLNANYCPVSDLIHTKLNGYNYYPYEFLYNEEITTTNKSILSNNNNYTCEAYSIPDIFNCFYDYKACPITKQNIIDATNKSNSYMLNKNYLCPITKTITNEKEAINIFVFGGSVTIGHQSNGCYCDKKLNNKCDSHIKYEVLNEVEDRFPYSKSYITTYQQYTTSCSWISYMKRGINHVFPANVNIYNLASSGTDSLWASDMLNSFFSDRSSSSNNSVNEYISSSMSSDHIPIPTGNDIIFIDYSVNDAATMYPNESFIGIEKLIRNLFILSRNNHNNDNNNDKGLPKIILLEAFPYPRRCDFNSGMYSQSCLDFDYSNYYTRIAKNYQIPIWSMKDVANSIDNSNSGNTNNNNNKHIKSYLKYQHNRAGDVHPPWMVHLYSADVILSSLKNEIMNCFDYNMLDKSKTISSNSDNNKNKNNDNNKLLPEPINEEAYGNLCNPKYPLLLDISAYNIITHRYNTGKFITYKPSTWKIIEESKHKIGWVSQLYNSSNNNTSNSNDYEHNIKPNNYIIYEFDHRNLSLDIIKQRQLLIKVQYLKSYENVGIIHLYLCNSLLSYAYSIDSYWIYISISVAAIHTTRLKINDYCDDQTIMNNKIQLKIKHIQVICDYNTSEECKARKLTQKFKLLQVTGCLV